MTLTRKEAKRIIGATKVYGPYYCSSQKYREAFPNYQLNEVGYNYGLYGWNWTLYYDVNNDAYIMDGYRNTPNMDYIKL